MDEVEWKNKKTKEGKVTKRIDFLTPRVLRKEKSNY